MGDEQRPRWRGWAAPRDEPADSVSEKEAVDAEEDAVLPADVPVSEGVTEDDVAEEMTSDRGEADDTLTAEEAPEMEEGEATEGESLEDEAMLEVEDLEATDEQVAD